MSPKSASKRPEDSASLRQRGQGRQDPAAEAQTDLHDGEEQKVKSDLTGEYANIGVLMVLYTLQGLPMGLAAVLPMIMKSRGVSFSDVGFFQLNTWPFSLKLLWAPLVDTVYFARIGRRKTWLVPTQLAIGVLMLGMSLYVDDLLYAEQPAVLTLTGVFFALYFLCATQDIAVDGWALTMLRPENVAWAASTNACGQTLGYAIGFTGYVMLEQHKIVTLASFMAVLGVIFIIITVLVALFKSEKPVPPEDEPEGIVESYQNVTAILGQRPVQKLILFLFTWKICFPIGDSVAPLKLQEVGVPKEHIAYMSSMMMPLFIALPVIAAKWTSGKAPLDLSMAVYPVRVACVPLTAALVYFAPTVMDPMPYGFYALVLLFGTVGAVCSQFMFASQMSFFARVSDPSIGATYMTLLNTISNLGGMWPSTPTYYLVDALSCKESTCFLQMDGFYAVTALATVIGFAWYLAARGTATSLQERSLQEWRVR